MVRTRFAPSPTGYLHIGGVRTALFCWLFARQHGGKFLLRIDDTDQGRNVEAALAPILNGFRWLGLDWDEGPEVGGPHAPYYQSQRLDRHQEAAAELLRRGFAYRDYARPEEIQAERETAQREKRSFLYSRRWMAETPEDEARFEAEGRSAVVRLKMPRDGTLVLDDLVRGRVEFAWEREQDHVIQRADGSCLYHLATMVDDHDFEITHVIRSEEHLSNTPRQVFIAQSLGYEVPQFAHLPYVAAPGGKEKLSKRKLAKYLKNPEFKKLYDYGMEVAGRLCLGTEDETFNPVIVDFYEQIGYLPDAILNYLLLLGWSLDDRTEFFTREQMIEHFSLERVNKAPASFDPGKLAAFQDHYMQQLPTKQKVPQMLGVLQRSGLVTTPPPCDVGPQLAAIVEACGDRLKTPSDILLYADFFFVSEDRLEYDEKTFKKRVGAPGAADLLCRFRDRLATAESFDAPSLERLLKEFVEAEQIKIGQIIHAIRLSVTGKAVGPGLFDCLSLLGRERCLGRIDRALAKVESRESRVEN